MSTVIARALRLKETRVHRGMSQTELAKALGIARQTYVDMETGKTDMSCERLLQLANILNVSPTYLLLGDAGFTAADSLNRVKSLTEQLASELGQLGVFPCIPPHNQTRA